MSFWHSHNSQMLVVLFISMVGTHPPQKCPFKSFFSLNSAAGKLYRNVNFLLRFKKYIATKCKIICQPGVEILSWKKCLQAECKLTNHYKNVQFSFSENEKNHCHYPGMLFGFVCAFLSIWFCKVPPGQPHLLLDPLWGGSCAWETCRWRGLAITQFLSQVWASSVLK